MAQRRSYAPLPTNQAHVNAHGREAGPPNLQPAPQPLPPRPQPQPQPQSMIGDNAAAPRPPLPASIPLRPMAPTPQSMQPQPGMMPPAPPPGPPTPGAGIAPANADLFTQPAVGGDEMNAADPHSALLKLLAGLGHTGAPDAHS